MQLEGHRVATGDIEAVCAGRVRFAPLKSLWFLGMLGGATIGGALTFSWSAVAVFVCITVAVLLFGHSLGKPPQARARQLPVPEVAGIHARVLRRAGGLAGPIGLLRQHELRDYAQRLPRMSRLSASRPRTLGDAWWQLNCELQLERPPRRAHRAADSAGSLLSFARAHVDGAAAAAGRAAVLRAAAGHSCSGECARA